MKRPSVSVFASPGNGDRFRPVASSPATTAFPSSQPRSQLNRALSHPTAQDLTTQRFATSLFDPSDVESE